MTRENARENIICCLFAFFPWCSYWFVLNLKCLYCAFLGQVEGMVDWTKGWNTVVFLQLGWTKLKLVRIESGEVKGDAGEKNLGHEFINSGWNFNCSKLRLPEWQGKELGKSREKRPRILSNIIQERWIPSIWKFLISSYDQITPSRLRKNLPIRAAANRPVEIVMRSGEFRKVTLRFEGWLLGDWLLSRGI